MGLGVGADDYVPKPFSVKELVARVKAVLLPGNDLAVEFGVPFAEAARDDLGEAFVGAHGPRELHIFVLTG